MNFSYRIKQHLSFSQKETSQIFLTSFFVGLIMFFYVWRTKDFDLISGISYTVLLIILGLCSIFFKVISTKIVAIQNGFEATYSAWTNGLLVGFLVSFISYGFVPLIMGGKLEITPVKRLRHGKLFLHANKNELFSIISTATMTCIFLAFIGEILFRITGWEIIYYFALMNAFLAFFSLLPLTETIGSVLLYVNRNRYLYLLASTITYIVFLMVRNILAFPLALLSGAVVYFIVKKFFHGSVFT